VALVSALPWIVLSSSVLRVATNILLTTGIYNCSLGSCLFYSCPGLLRIVLRSGELSFHGLLLLDHVEGLSPLCVECSENMLPNCHIYGTTVSMLLMLDQHMHFIDFTSSIDGTCKFIIFN
jgi:hypothetical protein